MEETPSSSQASSWTTILPEGEDRLAGCSRPPQVASGPETRPPCPPRSFVFCNEFPFLVPEEANRPGAWFCPTDHILSPSPRHTDPAASWGHRHVSRMGVPSAPSLTPVPAGSHRRVAGRPPPTPDSLFPPGFCIRTQEVSSWPASTSVAGYLEN